MRKFLYKVNKILFFFYKSVNSSVYLQAKSDIQRTATVAKTLAELLTLTEESWINVGSKDTGIYFILQGMP